MNVEQLMQLVNSLSDEQKRDFSRASKQTLTDANKVPAVAVGEKGGLVFRNIGGARSPHLWGAQFAALVDRSLLIQAMHAIETRIPDEQRKRLTPKHWSNLQSLHDFLNTGRTIPIDQLSQPLAE